MYLDSHDVRKRVSAPITQHQSTAASMWWCGPRPRLGWVEMAVGLPESTSYTEHSSSFFRYDAR